MDSISIMGTGAPMPAPKGNNNKQRSTVSFGSNSLNNDTFESQNKKPKKTFFANIANILHTLFGNGTEELQRTPIQDEGTPLQPQVVPIQPQVVPIQPQVIEVIDPHDIMTETTAPAPNFDAFNFNIPEEEKVLPDTEMAKFLQSSDYETKIQKASTGKYQKELMEMLSFDNLDFNTKKAIANSGLSEEEFLNAVKKLSKSTLKAALNNPELYINYTQDVLYQRFVIDSLSEGKEFPDKKTEAGAYMAHFLQKNIAKVAKALQYIDTDTLNQMMDKRSTGFLIMLNSLDELTPENGKILKELISHTKEGNAKQKIKLCQLVSIFQSNDFDINMLKDLSKNLKEGETIDTSSLNDMFKKALIKKAGLECETEKTNTDFNEEYIHLLFSEAPVLDSGHRAWSDDFENFLKAAVSGEFEEYITDETNKYGKANKNTEEKFKQYGLDYKKWFHPNFKENNFTLNGKNMSVKMWDRNPQEDIFIGNKTRCCTAITTGSNSAAMPVFMMNTAFNYIEVTDNKNDVKGMARIYMSDVEGEPSVIIDSIELSDIKQMSDDDKTIFANNIFQYAKEFGETIAQKPVNVYYITQDLHLPIDKELDKQDMKQNEFIGDISSEKVYSNRNSGSRWDDLREKVYTNLYMYSDSAIKAA